MRRSPWLVVIAFAAFLASTATYLFSGSEGVREVVGDVIPIVTAACAAISFWLVYRKMQPVFRTERKGWQWTAIAFTLFFAGECAWAFWELVLKESLPLGTGADLFWNLGYIAWAIAIGYALSARFIKDLALSKAVLWAAGILASVYLGTHVLKLAMGAERAADFIQNLYPAYDIVLFGLVIVLLIPLLRTRNPLTAIWVVFGLTILARIVFDVVFAGLTAIGAYKTGDIIDIFYDGSYVLGALAAYLKLQLLYNGSATMHRERGGRE